ncbi:MAG: hypothetical protein DRN91_02105 [Candidatus Alkanophagales archaeon]|nr:MAG: hypothetical protein DRN91_02105 [Candidatus Alkanophagales archaeon]
MTGRRSVESAASGGGRTTGVVIEKKDILIAVILFLTGFLIRIAGVSNVCMYGDEWLYWFDMKRILVSGFVPRADVFDFSPPFLPYLGAAVTMIFDGDLNTIRMISVIFGSLSIPYLYLLGKTMYDWRVGLLSGVFLCFSAYHCLYSRVFMLDVPMLFFIIAFLYYFWLSQRPDNPRCMMHACIAGAMLGLAFDMKYLAIFLLPATLAYAFWVGGFRLRALLDRRILLMLLFAFLFFLPLLVCLFYTGVGFHGFEYYAIERFETEKVTNVRPYEFSPDELLYRGGKRLLEVFAWGADLLSPPLPHVFKLSMTFLILIVLFSYLLALMRREKEGSFLMISVFMLLLLISNCGNVRHYLISLLPFFYVMFSYTILHNRAFRVVVVPLAAVVISLSIATAVTSPYWDTGDYHSWARSAVEHIRMDAAASGIPSDQVSIGLVYFLSEILDRQSYISGFNASTVYLFKPASKYSGEVAVMSLDRLNRLKPDYLVVNEDFYEHYFSDDDKREVFRDYRIILYSYEYPQHYFILKRKSLNVPTAEQAGAEMSSTGVKATISRDAFKASVPGVMEVGKAYTVLVRVKNEGNATNFVMQPCFDKFTIFVDQKQFASPIFIPKEWRFSLSKGESRVFKLRVLPFREHVGKMPLTVELYAESEDGVYRKVDSCTDYVYLIR